MRVEVIHCPATGLPDRCEVTLEDGAMLRDAVMASGLPQRLGSIDESRLGVWGKLRPPDHVLRDGDRVEVYRPLLIDPMESRRRRQKVQRNNR